MMRHRVKKLRAKDLLKRTWTGFKIAYLADCLAHEAEQATEPEGSRPNSCREMPVVRALSLILELFSYQLTPCAPRLLQPQP